METTEKGMKIVVTRAPRIRKANYADLPADSYYLGNAGNDKLHLVMKDVPSRRVDNPFTLPYDLNLEANEVIPFDSFDHMCRWVSMGRKLEDLEGDAKEEFKTLAEIPAGIICKVIDNKGFGRFKWGDVVMVSKEAKGVMSLVDGDSCPFADLNGNLTGIENILAWPIDTELGDTITITCKGH